MVQKNVPDVFAYTNYRQYITDFYEARKKSTRGYSHRQFSQAGGFASPSALKMIAEGQRNLTPQSTEQCVKALALAGKQAEYFRVLVSFNQTQDALEREDLFAQLQKIRPHNKAYQLEADTVEYVQHWIYSVIRELIHAEDFRDDPIWIKNRLSDNADLKDIAAALSFLKGKGFIAKDEKGKYQSKVDVVLGSDEVRSLALRGYYRRILEQAAKMLEILPMEKREYRSLIFHMPEEDVPELKAKLKKVWTDLHHWSLSREKKGGVVIQMNLQMYPQTKKD